MATHSRTGARGGKIGPQADNQGLQDVSAGDCAENHQDDEKGSLVKQKGTKS